MFPLTSLIITESNAFRHASASEPGKNAGHALYRCRKHRDNASIASLSFSYASGSTQIKSLENNIDENAYKNSNESIACNNLRKNHR